MSRLEEIYDDQIAFESINAQSDSGAALFQQLSLPGHPGYVVFSANGQEVFRSFGVVEFQVLEQPIIDLLNNTTTN